MGGVRSSLRNGPLQRCGILHQEMRVLDQRRCRNLPLSAHTAQHLDQRLLSVAHLRPPRDEAPKVRQSFDDLAADKRISHVRGPNNVVHETCSRRAGSTLLMLAVDSPGIRPLCWSAGRRGRKQGRPPHSHVRSGVIRSHGRQDVVGERRCSRALVEPRGAEPPKAYTCIVLCFAVMLECYAAGRRGVTRWQHAGRLHGDDHAARRDDALQRWLPSRRSTKSIS